MQIKDSLPVGTILDSGVRKYVIKSVLGQGGFGITYLATSTVYAGNIPIEAQFAIKEHYISTMNKRQGTSVAISNENNTAEIKESIDSFLVEAQRLNKLSLNHPGIVRVNECFRANGTAYYVMEYIKSQSLREHVKRSSQGRLSEDEALKLFRPIAETIGYLHDNKVTHLDIKPDNILIRENGEPVVIDFGLSKHYSSKGTPTSTIKAAGCSAGYSPMEQYVGITTFTPEADIYALGATLLYMLTGKDPILSTDINEDIIRRSIPQVVSRQTSDAIIHAMEKLKENRTKSITTFLWELENELDNSTYEDVDSHKTIKKKISSDFSIAFVIKTFIRRFEHGLRRSLKKIGVGGTLFVIAYGIYILLWNNNREDMPDDKPHQTTETKTTDTITVGSGKNSYRYFGELKNGIPNGFGTAIYSDGVRKEYYGYFVKGLRHCPKDSAYLGYINGDSYTGTFVNDHFSEGDYHVRNDRSFFRGTFKNDEPYNGAWYNSQYKIISKVVNGVER